MSVIKDRGLRLVAFAMECKSSISITYEYENGHEIAVFTGNDNVVFLHECLSDKVLIEHFQAIEEFISKTITEKELLERIDKSLGFNIYDVKVA